MMQMRDWISGLVGAAIFCLGLFPVLGMFEFLSDLPATILIWIVAIAGLYLMVNSIIEITNSNVVGWVSFSIAAAAFLVGLLPVLHSLNVGPSWFEFGWLSRTVYNIVFMLEGAFLMIATFAMEL